MGISIFLCLVEGLIKKWWLLESTPRVPQIQGSLCRFPETGTPDPQAISFYLTKVGWPNRTQILTRLLILFHCDCCKQERLEWAPFTYPSFLRWTRGRLGKPARWSALEDKKFCSRDTWDRPKQHKTSCCCLGQRCRGWMQRAWPSAS